MNNTAMSITTYIAIYGAILSSILGYLQFFHFRKPYLKIDGIWKENNNQIIYISLWNRTNKPIPIERITINIIIKNKYYEYEVGLQEHALEEFTIEKALFGIDRPIIIEPDSPIRLKLVGLWKIKPIRKVMFWEKHSYFIFNLVGGKNFKIRDKKGKIIDPALMKYPITANYHTNTLNEKPSTTSKINHP
ncbi:MAG: hypothetical protein M0Q12_05760 [Synergistaceae bacterium]|jgi:hypothetical protein|nr:hypothetical protein [Synergistaceae bacterium]MDD2199366.1 hypothetical protein [Bacteroidales bacterium]